MSAYVLASYDIDDADGYQAYISGVIPLLGKHKAELLTAEHDARKLEGEKRGTYILLKFESEEAALAWYEDPAYAPVKKLRLDATSNGSMVIAKQFVPPRA